LLIVSGCSGRWHIQRAIKKGVIIERDTIFEKIYIPGDSGTVVDTVQFKQIFIDTIEFKIQPKPTKQKPNPGPIKGKIKLTRANDTVFVYTQVECPPDTLVVPVEVNTSVNCPKCKGFPAWLFWSGITAAFLGGLFLRLWFKSLTGL